MKMAFTFFFLHLHPENYEDGRKKARAAEETSDIQTADEDAPRKYVANN
jgi:hypothetical protein